MVTTIKTQYTGVEIPAGLEHVTLKILGEHPSRDGVAFSAEVHNDVAGQRGHVVGIIENQGNGGGTWFYNHTFADRQWWDALVKEFAGLPACEYPELADEHLADVLYDNAAMFRDLNRKRSPLVRWNGDNDDIRIYRGKWDPALEGGLKDLALKESATVERWVKSKGWVAL